MTRLLIPSDYLSIRSDEHSQSIRPSSANTTPQTAERVATARSCAAWLVDRDLQQMRSADLSLSRRSRTRPQAISGDQSARRASSPRICTKCRLRTGRRMARQLSPATRCTQRDLRHQCRTSASTRGSRIDCHGPGVNHPRLCQGRSHRRRYDRVLPRCRRSTVGSGGAQ
jgi:uncharacterized protein with von Willebrand factor type A (vWA) domain